jgi:oxalate decarboxylase
VAQLVDREVLQERPQPLDQFGEGSSSASSSASAPGSTRIDLWEWIAGNPPDVLATNFGNPASHFERFPRRDVFIASKDGT